jgi:hypothetical protein
VRGSGNITQQQREIGSFNAVNVTGVGVVEITQGDADRLTVATDDNLQDAILSEVRGDTLYLGMKPDVSLSKATQLTFIVTVKNLQRIALSGAAKITARDLKGAQLVIDHSGAGVVTTMGSITAQHVSLSGAGSYDGAALISDRTTVDLSGFGNVVVNVHTRLDATLSGAGSVEYIGSPELHKQISGLGSVRQRAP